MESTQNCMLTIQVGLRVIRGPDWKWSDEDGGDGCLGTVCDVEPKLNNGITQPGLVSVVWDFDNKVSLYRVGAENSFDLSVYDSGPVGIHHGEFHCDACESGRPQIIGTRYSCDECNNYDLCGVCYSNDKHSLNHRFHRVDMPGMPKVFLPPRNASRKIYVKGFSVGAKVTRGIDWEWNSQDGGPKKSGRIIGILDGKPNESFRSSAKVLWNIGKENNYRIGIRGKVDLKCVATGTTYFCYKDHLPILGKPWSEIESTCNVFRRGDRVLLSVNAEELEFIQQQQRESGGWNPHMVKFIGQAGTVHRVTEQGSVRIKFDLCDHKWTFDPRALSKVDEFCVGDYVRFINDEAKVREYLKGHGEWIESMRKDLGKVGCVIKVYEDQDMRVVFDISTWTLSPKCVELMKRCIQHTRDTTLNGENPSTSQIGSPEERSNISTYLSQMNIVAPSSTSQSCLNTMPLEHFPDNCTFKPEIASPLLTKTPSLYNPSLVVPLILEVMREMVEGNPQALDSFVAKYTDAIDCPVAAGKTLLQITAFRGYPAQVDLLIQKGANIQCTDEAGDTALHFAAYGNQPQVIDHLIKAGVNINSQNQAGHTPLHVAVNKNFVQFVQELIKHDCDVNVQDNNQDTPLHDALVRSIEEIQVILVNHPQIDLFVENALGFNPFNQAVLRGNINVIEMMLGKDTALASTSKSTDGFSPLHVASCNGLVEVIKLLLEKFHVDVNALDFKNKTPLVAAIARGQCNVIHYLVVKQRASLRMHDIDGNSVLHTLFIKRSSFKNRPNPNSEPLIYQEYIEVGGHSHENATLLGVALFLIKHGASLSTVNLIGQKPLDLILQDTTLMNQILELSVPFLSLEDKNLVTGVSELSIHELVETSNTSAPKSVPVECSVCSELGVANVILKPCFHAVACEECSSRMKKCINCKTPIVSRITQDGRLVPSQERHEKSKTERVNYLQSKINEFEEMNTCTICMERCRNTIFLCGHGTCEICANTLKYCHMCRKLIEHRINVFL